MKLIIYGLLFTLFSFPIAGTTENEETKTKPYIYIREPENIVLFGGEEKPKFNYSIDREEAIAEVVDYWNYIFDTVQASKTDWRRLNFKQYATWLVDSLRYYQDTIYTKEFEPRTNIRLMMPNGRYTHLLVAYIVYKESSVNPNVVGSKPRFEVGFMQLWSLALNGHTRKEVMRDPELGLRLGIRWLSLSYNDCELPSNHELDHWRGPLALYGSKRSKVKKNGKCRTNFGFANQRVDHVKNYISNFIEI